ncbi:MAG: co-chaperone YbbN [Alphaproteobacteria bacterium]|nr:co-chaperone YbbN [Alphaproteobacteria bacterium]
MLGLGSDNDNTASRPEGYIYEVNTNDFEAKVMSASMETPVIVDFWAPWCGPCKQLMPVLEKTVMAAKGEVILAKVNLDENPELAQALRVQSVPTVFAFYGGRPVDAFQGMQPESTIQAFIDKLVQAARANKPEAIDIPETLKAAAEALANKDLQMAQGLYMQILQQDENNAPAYAGLIRTFIAAGVLDQAQSMLENAPERIAGSSELDAVKTALEMAKNAETIDIQSLEQAVEKNPEDHQALIDLAEGQFTVGQKEEAIETVLKSIEINRNWNEDAARKTLLKFFEALGHGDPLTIEGRKKLSSILFS